MTRDPHDTCEHCPAWAQIFDHDGKELLVPLRGADGQPVTRDGAVQYEKDAGGRFVRSGSCRLFRPVLMPNGVTTYPSPKSNWFCEDPARHDMLARLAKRNSVWP